MIVIDTLFVVDIAVILSLLVLANLSRRIGEALSIPKFYYVYFVSTAMILGASFIDLTVGINIDGDGSLKLSIATLLIRGLSLLISIPVALRYWSWLFKEKVQA